MIIDDSIQLVNNDISFDSLVTRQADTTKAGNFEQFYNAAIGILNETNMYQHEADQIQLDFAAGKTDNLLSVMMAQEKAHSSLNFTVSVTNKIMEAYREIMRLQV